MDPVATPSPDSVSPAGGGAAGGPVNLAGGPPETGGGRAPVWRTFGILLVAVVLVVAAVWIVPNLVNRTASGPAANASPSAVAAPSAAESALSAAPTPALSIQPIVDGPPVSLPKGRTLPSGSIAVVENDGSLAMVDAKGRTLVLSPPGDATYAFPAWSPDGTHLAAIRYDATGTSILVFDAARLAAGDTTPPVVIFRSSSIGPFYASWTPDGRQVSFLADEADALSLRLAPADGSAPLDGTGPGSKIRTGNPLYFDWIGNDRLLAHVGSGADSFLGEIGLDGAPIGPQLQAPGLFRPAVVNHDGSLISYVRAASSGPASVVVARRDGSHERTMPVYGTAGVSFNPTGDIVASIGPTVAGGQPFSIPIGALRLLDATSGKVRTLLDGSVVSFWWSPDAKTIAALRVQPIAGGSSGSGAGPSARPSDTPAETPLPSHSPIASAVAPSLAASSAAPGPTAAPGSSAAPDASPAPSRPPSEVRLVFLDVASGRITSQSVVEPGQVFIDQFLTYFDQYALSHQLWAPDSSALLLPVTASDGSTHVSVISRDGEPPINFDGAIAFWSP